MLSELCVRRPVFATMLVTSLVVLGIFSFQDLGVDLFPKADPATVNVRLQLPGASPDEMTTSVVMPMENALSGIAGIDQLQANVQAGGSANITVRFVLERNLDDAANNVREKVAGAMRAVPPEVLPPVIQTADPDADSIMTIVLASKEMSIRALTEVADKQVKRALESVDGVGAVTLSGGSAREIHIVVDIEKLNARGLSIEQVREAIQKENVEIPGGTIEQGAWEVGLRTLGRIEATSQFDNIIVATVDGVPVRVADIGTTEDTVERTGSILTLEDGSTAVQLELRRASGENTIRVIEAVKERLDTVRRALPQGVTLTISSDDSRFIYASISSLEEHLIWGSLLAAVVVMFFMRNLRAVLISALAIPASIIATFTLMRGMDFTLNNMTLLGLTLAVGIVIDDAIVVLENIFRYIEEKQCSPFEAAIQGTREVALPVMATTLSLIVIFLPVAFMTGYARRFIYPFGWTMAFAILVSMLVSFTLTPMLSSRFLKVADAEKDLKTKDRGIFHWIDTAYARSLEWALAHPLAILGVTVVVLALTIPLNRMIGRTFIPAEDMGEFTAHVDTPQGTSLEGTRGHCRGVVNEVRGQEGVARVHYIAGADRVNHFHIVFYLQPADERDVSQEVVMARVREILAKHPAYAPAITAKNPLGGGNGNFAIQASLLGPDMNRLYDYSQQLLAKAQQLPSLVDTKSNFSNASPEVHVSVDRARAADLGVRISDIGGALRLMVAGDDEISTFRDGGEQYPVKIRVIESQRARRRGDRQAHRAVLDRRARPHRQHRRDGARPGADAAATSQPSVQHRGPGRSRARPRARRSVGRDAPAHDRAESAARLLVRDAGADAVPGRDDCQPAAGDRAREHLRLHRAGGAVRKLRAADHHHAGAAGVGAVRALYHLGDRPHAEPLERARHPAALRHREEELDPAGGLHQRPAAAGRADARGDRRSLPHPAAADPHDDERDHRRPAAHRPRDRRRR